MKVLANNRFPSGSSQFAYVHKYEPYAKAPPPTLRERGGSAGGDGGNRIPQKFGSKLKNTGFESATMMPLSFIEFGTSG